MPPIDHPRPRHRAVDRHRYDGCCHHPRPASRPHRDAGGQWCPCEPDAGLWNIGEALIGALGGLLVAAVTGLAWLARHPRLGVPVAAVVAVAVVWLR